MDKDKDKVTRLRLTLEYCQKKAADYYRPSASRKELMLMGGDGASGAHSAPMRVPRCRGRKGVQ